MDDPKNQKEGGLAKYLGLPYPINPIFVIYPNMDSHFDPIAGYNTLESGLLKRHYYSRPNRGHIFSYIV